MTEKFVPYINNNGNFVYRRGKSGLETALTNIHSPDACAERHCVIHNPSDHHMRDWPLNWRGFDGMISIKPSHFERICPHGIGHPDPDDLAYFESMGKGGDIGLHGCDRCCIPPEEISPAKHTEAQLALLVYMEQWSEMTYCAGWLHDLAHAMKEHNDFVFPWLVEQAGGYWVWGGGSRKFIKATYDEIEKEP